jgi:hypothetical protein
VDAGLRPRGRARRVDDDVGIVGGDGCAQPGVGGLGIGYCAERTQGHHHHAAGSCGRGIVAGDRDRVNPAPIGRQLLVRRQVVEAPEGRGGHDRRHLRVVEDVPDLVTAVDRHDRDRHGAEPCDRRSHDGELGPVRQLHRHPVACRHTPLAESGGEPDRLVAQLLRSPTNSRSSDLGRTHPPLNPGRFRPRCSSEDQGWLMLER